jgi:hypothetical protein
VNAGQDTKSDVQAGPSSPAQPLLRWTLPALITVAAYMVLVRPYVSTGTVLGDLGDARFNLYILEHTFRWLIGLDASYQSPDFYYPYPGVLLFSDTHVGSVPFYVLFRSLGASPFTAFTLWIFAGYVLTFWASYHAFLRFGFDPLSAAIGAVVFSFSLPSLAQVGHAQLTYRAGIPLAFLGFSNLLRRGSVRDACLLVVSVSYQFLCNVYLGVFLLLALGAFAIWLIVLDRDWRRFAKLPSQLIEDMRRHFVSSVVWLSGTAATIAATVLLLYAHQRWGALYGLGRHWQEVSEMVPRPQSYFLMNVLRYWDVVYTTVVNLRVPVAHEHNLFFGVGALCLFAVGSAATLSGRLPTDIERLSKAALLALAFLFVCLTKFGNVSLYYYISVLPGLNAIRAVSRVGIVLVFPATLVVAAGIHFMLRARPVLPGAIAVLLLTTIVAAEIVMLEKSSFKIQEANSRVDSVMNAARERSAGIEKPILFFNKGGELGYKLHLDAMFAAQRLGWPTVNGYSSAGVPGSDYQPDCDTPANQVDAYQGWSRSHKFSPVIDVQSFQDRLVVVGWPDCSNTRTKSDGWGPEPQPELARKISLFPVSLENRKSEVVFEIGIRNEGSERLVVRSFRPVRVSWRFVAVGADIEKSFGWDTRKQLARDVLPHSSSNVALTARLPGKPGEYRLQVSLVSELAYWFHDQGMEILQFDKLVSVR